MLLFLTTLLTLAVVSNAQENRTETSDQKCQDLFVNYRKVTARIHDEGCEFDCFDGTSIKLTNHRIKVQDQTSCGKNGTSSVCLKGRCKNSEYVSICLKLGKESNSTVDLHNVKLAHGGCQLHCLGKGYNNHLFNQWNMPNGTACRTRGFLRHHSGKCENGKCLNTN